MQILIINAHPEPQSFCSSLFNSAVATLELAGHLIQISYKPDGFNGDISSTTTNKRGRAW
jgi:putative NADPH-quinone reductase